MKVKFDDLIPAERQLILVASDEKYKALVSAIPWERRLIAMPDMFLPYRFLLNFVPIGKDKLRQMLRRGEIPIPHLSPAEAVDRYYFDYGHPLDGGAYIAHPMQDEHYLIPAFANERLAQEKVTAFLDLTAALGAKKLQIVSAEFLDKKLAERPDILEKTARVGIEYSQMSKVDDSAYVFREFQKPTHRQYVPNHVKRWLDEDPIFSCLANGRLKANVLTDQAQLRVENRLSISSSLTLGLKKKGIYAGGKSRDVVSAIFVFFIEYWPIDNEADNVSK